MFATVMVIVHRNTGPCMLFSRNRIYVDVDDEQLAHILFVVFVIASFVRTVLTDTTHILLILSTPRSGSTLLCAYLRQIDFCVAHEYFQPFQYLPLLAKRWRCARRGVLNNRRFVDALAARRTHHNGWLGINLHGSHLDTYRHLAPHLPKVTTTAVFLRRRDLDAQAVSYEIASQTHKWSSHYGRRHEPEYDGRKIRHRRAQLVAQNAAIEAFLNVARIDAQMLYYEDLVDDAASALGALAFLRGHALPSDDAGIRRQATTLNAQWLERLASETAS